MTQRAGRGKAGQILDALMKGQTLKYLIFSVLLLNFVQYFLEEAQQASLMLTAESPLLAWTSVFVTTIDELGWIVLSGVVGALGALQSSRATSDVLCAIGAHHCEQSERRATLFGD